MTPDRSAGLDGPDDERGPVVVVPKSRLEASEAMSGRENTARREREAINHRCSYCYAAPGDPCISQRKRSDGATKHPHPERLEVARRALSAARNALAEGESER